MALPTVNRLKDKKDFERVFKKGNAVKGNFLFIKLLENCIPVSRFGFIVPAKIISSAVARNRIKRIFSEVARKYIDQGQKNLDILVIFNKKGDEKALTLELAELLARNK